MNVKKKQPPHNAYYFFMLEFRQKEQKRGMNYGGMKEVAEAAAPLWKNMSKQEREPYEKKAKEEKGTAKKYTSQGVDIDIIKKEEEEAIKREEDMKMDIQRTINMAVNCNKLSEEFFYIMHMNEFCYCHSNNRYYLAELAVCRFSLAQGVRPKQDVFHMMVNPGPLPLGYKYQAKKKSSDTHQIPYPESDMDENNMDQVFRGFVDFICEGRKLSIDDYPALYVMDVDEQKIRNVMRHFCNDNNLPENTFKLYDLIYMFFKLCNAAAEIDRFPVLSSAKAQLEKDLYDYAKGIACEFHETSDAMNHCSRSHVVRRAFQICDFCCEHVGVSLVPGTHIPLETQVLLDRHHQQQTAQMRKQDADDGSDDRATSSSEISSIADSFSSVNVQDDGADEGEWTKCAGKRVPMGKGRGRLIEMRNKPPGPTNAAAAAAPRFESDTEGAAAYARPPQQNYYQQSAARNDGGAVGSSNAWGRPMSQNSSTFETDRSDFPSLGSSAPRRTGRGRGVGVAWNRR